MKNEKRKLKNYRVSAKAVRNHKKVWNLLHIITFIPIAPLVLVEKLGELLTAFVELVAGIRSKIIDTIFKIIYIKECNYYPDDEE